MANTNYHIGTVHRVGKTHLLLCQYARSHLRHWTWMYHVWTAPPRGGQKQSCSPVRSSRRRMVAYGTSPARLRPLPSLTQPGPYALTTTRGVFEILNSTSDSKRRRDKQSLKETEGSEDSCLLLGGKFFVYVFIVYIMMLLSKGTETY